MGILTDFVVADDGEAQRLGDEREAFEGGVEAKGLSQIEMGTLYAILTGAEHDDTFLTEESSFAYAATDDGPWVQRIPEDMVRRLAELSDAELPGVADAWSKTEEFDPEYNGWTRADVTAFLPQFRELARRALTEGKTLFMWTSL